MDDQTIVHYDEEQEVVDNNHSLKYKNGKLHGECRFYDENGILLQRVFYKNDMLNGPMEIYENGILNSITYYENNQKNGCEIIYSLDNHLPQIMNFYENDSLHGAVITYHENGQIAQYQIYIQGIKHGIFRSYYANGILLEEGEFIKDKKDGIFKTHHYNGQLQSIRVYQSGVLAYPAKFFDEKGNEIFQKSL